MVTNIEQMEEKIATKLVANIRQQAYQKFKKGDGKYPYKFLNSFASDDVVRYEKDKHRVVVDHPAANRLEFGFGQLKIKAKDAQTLHFKGMQGEDVYTKEVTIKPTRPLYYVRAAIKQTKQELKGDKGLL